MCRLIRPFSYIKAPPPPWLTTALTELRDKYPSDSFEAWMKYAPIDRHTNEMLRAEHGGDLSANVKYQWLPRIKCNDCPGKLYQAGPGTTVENFEIHLRNRQHKERREGRENRNKSGA